MSMREMIEYALEAPNWNACRLILLDALHGVTGSENYVEIRATPAYRADADRLKINLEFYE